MELRFNDLRDHRGPHDNVLKTISGYLVGKNPRLRRIILCLKFIFFSKKVFAPPMRSQLLIYDANLIHTLDDYIKEWRPTTLYVRGESLNIYVLLRSFFRKGFVNGRFGYSRKWIFPELRGLFQNYVDEYIELVKPSLIITLVDNNPIFYTISSRHEQIKTLFIQNATRGALSFSDATIEHIKINSQQFI